MNGMEPAGNRSRPLSVPMDIGRQHISTDNPGGQPARDSDEFEALRKEFSKLSNIETPPVDWVRVCELSISLLGQRGKDLQTLVYFVRGLTELYGYRGLDIGLKITNDLLLEHWDRCHPSTDRSRARARILAWINESLTPRLEKMPPTKADTQSLHRALDQLTDLEELLQQRLENSAPSLGHLRRLLADYCGKLPLLAAVEPGKRPRGKLATAARLTVLEPANEPEPIPMVVPAQHDEPPAEPIEAPPLQLAETTNTGIRKWVASAVLFSVIAVGGIVALLNRPLTEPDNNLAAAGLHTPPLPVLNAPSADSLIAGSHEFVQRSREATRELLEICGTVTSRYQQRCEQIANELFGLSRQSYHWDYAFLDEHINAGEQQIAIEAFNQLEQRLRNEKSRVAEVFERRLISESTE